MKLIGGWYQFEQWKKVLTIDNLLTKQESACLISAANKVGFMSAQDIGKLEFPEYVYESRGGKTQSKNTAGIALVRTRFCSFG